MEQSQGEWRLRAANLAAWTTGWGRGFQLDSNSHSVGIKFKVEPPPESALRKLSLTPVNTS